MDFFSRSKIQQAVSRCKPVLRQIEHHVSPAVGNVLKAKIKTKQWYHYSRHHVAELDPYRILWIDPDEIHARNTKVIPKSERDLSHVVGGRWDTEQKPFELNFVYQSFRKRFEDNKDWKSTELYQQILRKVNQGEYVYNCQSKRDIEERLMYLDKLYETIATEGYKPNYEVDKTRPRSIDAYRPTEIKVKIGRRGNFYYCNGKHRLSIAKLQDIEKIPVTVTVRHTDWQTYRNQIARSLKDKQTIKGNDLIGDEKCYREHPDIAYLI